MENNSEQLNGVSGVERREGCFWNSERDLSSCVGSFV